MIQELDRIILATDMPEYNLKNGDIGTVFLVHQGGVGYEVEFVSFTGKTLAIASLFNFLSWMRSPTVVLIHPQHLTLYSVLVETPLTTQKTS